MVLSHCGFNLNMHISISKVIYLYIYTYIKFCKDKKEVTKNHFYHSLLPPPPVPPALLDLEYVQYNFKVVLTYIPAGNE